MNIYLIIFIVIFTIRNFAESRTRKSQEVPDAGKISLTISIAVYFVAALAAGYKIYLTKPNIYLFSLGILIFILGFGLRVVCLNKMGGNYTFSTTPVGGGFLVTGGPYSVVRHPIYLAYVIEFLGILIIGPNYTSLICLLIDAGTSIQRIGVEEENLAQKYNENYLKFKEKTPCKVIPFIY